MKLITGLFGTAYTDGMNFWAAGYSGKTNNINNPQGTYPILNPCASFRMGSDWSMGNKVINNNPIAPLSYGRKFHCPRHWSNK